MNKINYVNEISSIPQLYEWEIGGLAKVAAKFPFMSNAYYLGLINWDDARDPIRRLIIPSRTEIDDSDWGLIDASNEYSYQVVPGIQHKYADSALFLTTDQCFGRCRYCFRKRLFLSSGKYELLDKYDVAINYIKEHSEIDNVILSGGDPLTLSTKTLRHIISKLRQIEHLKIIRIGTKSLAFYPRRIIDDPSLLKLISEYSSPERRLYFMLHFSHPNEITDEAMEAVRVLLQAGAILYNQTPLVRGVNDDSKIIANLCNKLSYIGVTPYYFFQMRPTIGNKPFAIPLTEACQIFSESQRNLSGIAKTARLIMSHESGKIEIIELDESTIYFKQHRSPRSEECSQLMIAARNDNGYWLEDFNVKYLSADAQLAYYR